MFVLLQLGISTEIVKVSDRNIDTKRGGQNVNERESERKSQGGEEKEMKMERQKQSRETGKGGEGKESRRCQLLVSDSIDLHFSQNPVQHSAHMAPLNVARLEFVCVRVCICVYFCFLIYS